MHDFPKPRAAASLNLTVLWFSILLSSRSGTQTLDFTNEYNKIVKQGAYTRLLLILLKTKQLQSSTVSNG